MPISEARRVNRRATCSARWRASVLMLEDLVLNLLGLTCEQFLELCVAHDLGVVFEDLGDVLLVVGG